MYDVLMLQQCPSNIGWTPFVFQYFRCPVLGDGNFFLSISLNALTPLMIGSDLNSLSNIVFHPSENDFCVEHKHIQMYH